MASWNWSVNMDPKQVASFFKQYDVLTQNGEVFWVNITKAFPHVHFHYRWDTDNLKERNHQLINSDVAVKMVNRMIEQGQPVCVNVDAVGNDNRPDHWVLMKGKFGERDNMLDPAGTSTIFEQRYGDPIKKLFGFAQVYGDPVEFPVDGDYPSGKAIFKMIENRKYGIYHYFDEALRHLMSPKE